MGAAALVKLGVVEHKYVLRKPKFGKVADLNPESKSVNLHMKVVSSKKVGDKEFEVVAGDASGIVTISSEENFGEGKILVAQNCFVMMTAGYIRLVSGKWGKIAIDATGEDVEPKTTVDMSSTEYEL